MEIIRCEMPSNYELIDTSDFHIGVANTNENSIIEMIDYVASKKNRYMIIKGDLIDAIAIKDKRFSLASFTDHKVYTPQEQADRIIELLKPIRKKIKCILLGNHEFTLYNIFDFVGYWCKELEVPWGGITTKFVHLYKNEVKWKGLYVHGSGVLRSQAKDPIQAKANMKALLKKRLQYLASDCVYMSQGHTHTMLVVEPTIQDQLHLYDDGEKLKQTYRADVDQSKRYIDVEARWYVNTGSFLGTMSQPGQKVIPYSEIAMYAPVEQGYVIQTVEDHKLVDVKRIVV
jgi:hypothetical protein